jgi:hypothetical protein
MAGSKQIHAHTRKHTNTHRRLADFSNHTRCSGRRSTEHMCTHARIQTHTEALHISATTLVAVAGSKQIHAHTRKHTNTHRRLADFSNLTSCSDRRKTEHIHTRTCTYTHRGPADFSNQARGGGRSHTESQLAFSTPHTSEGMSNSCNFKAVHNHSEL